MLILPSGRLDAEGRRSRQAMGLFGTDGVRGIANGDLDAPLAFALGRAGAHVLAARSGRRPRVLVGRDTRRSGDLLEAALVAGALSVGADVHRLGVTTTPAVAYLVRALDVEAGAMISASHNPFEYNGIKFFDHSGFKLPDAVEAEIERHVADAASLPSPKGDGIGQVRDAEPETERYVDYLVKLAGDFGGMHVVVDCANGGASAIAPEVLRRAGMRVDVLHASPDGTNINDQCGSLHPESLQAEVKRSGASFGCAFDGDADRLIAVDGRGRVVDGDAILGVAGLHLLGCDLLPHRTVVATVMSNLGLELALRAAGARLLRTRVGDRYVLEEMERGGYALGGEQSGHVIFRSHHTTGDGLLTAVRLARIMADSGRNLADLADQVPRFPQVLRNVRVADAKAAAGSEAVVRAVAAAEAALSGRGRVLVRSSGTEPLVRVMVEGEDPDRTTTLAEELAAVVAAAAGGEAAE
jgi:phosphoglucosamine mutase